MLQLSARHISQEENETVINVSYASGTFSVYTTALRTSNMLKERFPEYYELAKDGASATANQIPLELITKLQLSKLKPSYHSPVVTTT